ncbi:MAG: methyltransferase domain-containing protein [Gaiellaceae bacterium]
MQSTDAYWDSVAESWSPGPGAAAVRRYSDAVAARLLERWLPDGIEALLKTDAFDEVAGEGLLETLAQRAGHVTLVDRSAQLIARVRERHPGVDAKVADVRALPFADASFDAVVSLSTLDHFDSHPQIERALAELARVTRPRGTLIVTLDNRMNPLVALRNLLPARLLRAIHLVPYQVGATLGPRALQAAVARSGFEIDETAATMHVPRLLVRALRWRALGSLLACERLDRWPTGGLTGQFAAVRAHRSADRESSAAQSRERHLLARVLSAAGYRRLALLELVLGDRPPAAATAAKVPLEFEFVAREAIAELAALRPGLGGIAQVRLARGDRCFVARRHGRIVAARWVARNVGHVEFLHASLPLSHDEAYNFDTWTHPDVRGLGVATATGAALYELLASEGVRAVLRAVWPENAGGMRNARREGFHRVGTLRSFGLGRLRIIRIERHGLPRSSKA